MNIAEKYMTDMELNEPSNPLEINKTEDKLKIKFPEQYKKFLLSHNGAEGSIGENSYLVIWSIEDIISLNEEYGVFEFTPEILYFGSDGGDMAYAFDRRNSAVKIVEIAFESISVNDAVTLSDDFDDFIKCIKANSQVKEVIHAIIQLSKFISNSQIAFLNGKLQEAFSIYSTLIRSRQGFYQCRKSARW